jgi:hypothetical protein
MQTTTQLLDPCGVSAEVSMKSVVESTALMGSRQSLVLIAALVASVKS